MKHVLLLSLGFLVACSANKTDIESPAHHDSIICNETNTDTVVESDIEEEINDSVVLEKDKDYEFSEGFAGLYDISSNIDSSRFDNIYCAFLYDSIIVIKERGVYWYSEETHEGDTIIKYIEFNNHYIRQYIRLNKINDDYCTLSVLDSCESNILTSKILDEMHKESMQEVEYKYFDYFEANIFNLQIYKNFINTETRYKYIKDNLPLSFSLSNEEEVITFNCMKKDY